MLFVAIGLFLLVTAGIAVLAYANLQDEAPLSLLIWHVPAVSVGLVCLFAFLLGALMLYFISLAASRQEGGELRKLRKRVAELEGGTLQEAAGTTPIAGPVVPMPGMRDMDISDIPTQH
jgi:uncharacterized integral membrane protein